jgi:hypothetical protein
MKTYLNKTFYKIFLLLFCLLGYVAHAADPPCPDGYTGPDCNILVPPTEKAPIDENLILFVSVSMIFGVCTIYKKLDKKRPI